MGHLALLVCDDGEADMGAGHVADVLDPALVAVDGVCRQADELDAALSELRLEASERAELGRAYGCVILRVREKDNPVVAHELVEVNGTSGGVSLEVGGNGAQAEARGLSKSARRVCVFM